jgi:4-hydroxy-tetrahydrodipicolinate synthase
LDQSPRTARDRSIHGIYSATLTPFDRDHKPDPSLAVPYYRSLLDRGCDGLNILGTTGEAMSVAIQDRLRFMESVAASLPAGALMVGTGATAFHDVVELTKAAFAFGFCAALVLPPFYYRDVTDAGVVRFFSGLMERVRPPDGGIFLYNFPRMTGLTFHAKLVEMLMAEFPKAIGGMKDSSNDIELERDLHARYPECAILPGSEELLPEVLHHGLAGCISGSVCLWPELAAEAWRERDMTKAMRVGELRLTLGAPFIPAVRARVAAEQKNEAWLRSIPPL